ncbi:MAG TPA: HAMP domain-containing histidine kinase [Rhodobacterales bacterium]|nr:HAMP domain-containing histidine kinase [Rhodobacterales bacterium]
MKSGVRLRSLGLGVMVAAFAAGLGAAWIWFASSAAWNAHLSESSLTGMAVHEALRTGAPLPSGVTATKLPPEQEALADRGAFSRLPGVPRPGYVTNMSVLTTATAAGDPAHSQTLSLGIVSDRLSYSVSQLASDPGQTAAQKFGSVTRLLATYCSEPVLFARLGSGTWWRIDGTAVWGCTAAPRDIRLLAVVLALLALAGLTTLITDATAPFERFARALRQHRRLGGPQSYSTTGPAELREIVAAVNAYLESERAQLAERAVVLSGVSHDLGTPATRLRLRTALIKEDGLREKLDADIDSMTGMIESVLTYTRAELNTEEPRQLSLTSLVEALVDDYRDLGRPVSLQTPKAQTVQGGRSVFTSATGRGAMPDEQPILVVARPISLQRAISNLIDNALKYGRRANVELRATADRVRIAVEDEGSGMSAAEVAAAVAPFKRGPNAERIDGFGLGLTIVATVAEQHGGQLSFEAGSRGVRAVLEIARS